MLDAKGWAEVTTIARQAIGKPALDMATDLANKPDNDWQDIMFRPALMQNYNLSVKGGGKIFHLLHWLRLFQPRRYCKRYQLPTV